jgi:hypothetical protein
MAGMLARVLRYYWAYQRFLKALRRKAFTRAKAALSSQLGNRMNFLARAGNLSRCCPRGPSCLFGSFPSRNGPFPQSRRQSAGLFVRRTICTSPRNPARGGQALDFLDLAKNCSFLIRKLRECPNPIYGWTLAPSRARFR